MREVVVHVGFPKCASTTLQRNVFPLVPGFEKRPIDDLSNAPRLVSNETILTSVAPDELAAIIPEARVLIVFREPLAYYDSAYAQHLRGLGTKRRCAVPPGEWLQGRIGDYRKAVAYTQALPATVIALDDLAGRAETLAALIGAPLDDVREGLAKPAKNARMTRAALWRRRVRAASPALSRVLYGPALAPIRQCVKAMIKDAPMAGLFPPELMARIEAETRDDYERLRALS